MNPFSEEKNKEYVNESLEDFDKDMYGINFKEIPEGKKSKRIFEEIFKGIRKFKYS